MLNPTPMRSFFVLAAFAAILLLSACAGPDSCMLPDSDATNDSPAAEAADTPPKTKD
jgi:hypothetical protein